MDHDDAQPEPDERDLTQGPIPKHMVRLAAPMALGIVAIMTMNLVDTYFVGQISTDALAAMSFTFPVVFFLASLTMGLGIGVTSVVSRSVGSGERDRARRVTTDALALSVVIVAVISVVGYFSIEPIFGLLGAKAKLMPLIREYMSIWYFGAAMLVVPMMGNAAIRAAGDTRTPALIMIVVALLNIGLDPLLIFGVGPWDGMGIGGAALASVIARVIALIGSTYILWAREDLLTFEPPSFEEAMESWRAVLRVGAPAAATRSVVPLTNAVVTALVAKYGTEAVAGYGAATRVEAFALVISNGLSSSLGPLVGQNWGAGERERIYKAIGVTCATITGFAIVIYAGLWIFAEPIAGLFTDSQEAIDVMALFLMIVPLGHAFQGTFQGINNSFNAIDRPIVAAGLSLTRTVGLTMPLAWAGSYLFDIEGIFWGIAAANIIIGVISIIATKPVIDATADARGA